MGGWEAWWRQQARHARRPLCIMRLSPFIGWRPFRQTSWVFLRFALLTDFKMSAAFVLIFASRSTSAPHWGYAAQCFLHLLRVTIAFPTSLLPQVMRRTDSPACIRAMNVLAWLGVISRGGRSFASHGAFRSSRQAPPTFRQSFGWGHWLQAS